MVGSSDVACGSRWWGRENHRPVGADGLGNPHLRRASCIGVEVELRFQVLEICRCVVGNGQSDCAVGRDENDVLFRRTALVRNDDRKALGREVGLGEFQRAGAIDHVRHGVAAIGPVTGHRRASSASRRGMDHRDATHGPDVDAAEDLSLYQTGDGASVPRQGDEERFPEATGRDRDTRLEVVVPVRRDSNGPREGLEWTCRYRRAAGEMVDSSEVGFIAVGEGDGGIDQRACIVLDTDVECDCRCLEDDVPDRCRCGSGRGKFQRCRLEGGGLIAVEPETHVVGICGR